MHNMPSIVYAAAALLNAVIWVAFVLNDSKIDGFLFVSSSS